MAMKLFLKSGFRILKIPAILARLIMLNIVLFNKSISRFF